MPIFPLRLVVFGTFRVVGSLGQVGELSGRDAVVKSMTITVSGPR